MRLSRDALLEMRADLFHMGYAYVNLEHLEQAREFLTEQGITFRERNLARFVRLDLEEHGSQVAECLND